MRGGSGPTLPPPPKIAIDHPPAHYAVIHSFKYPLNQNTPPFHVKHKHPRGIYIFKNEQAYNKNDQQEKAGT